MNIRFKCSKCNTIIDFQLDEAVVKHVVCPQCGTQYRAQIGESEPIPYRRKQGAIMEDKELNLTEEEEQLLRIIFKMGEALVYETRGFNADNGNCIDSNTLYDLKQKLGIYEIVD